MQFQIPGKLGKHDPRLGPVRDHAEVTNPGPSNSTNQSRNTINSETVANSIKNTMNKVQSDISKNIKKAENSKNNEFIHINTIDEGLNLDERCFVKVKIAHTKTKVLVDTGAQTNVITTKALFKLKSMNRRAPIKLEPSSLSSMIGASKSKITVKGSVKLDVTIGTKTTPITFQVVDDCSVDTILGLEGLNKLNAEINLGTMKIKFGTNTYNLSLRNNNNIKANKYITLPPNKPITILVKPDCTLVSKNILVEPTKEYKSIVLSTMTSPDLDNKIPATLFNQGKKTITINKGMSIATATAKSDEKLKE